MDIQDIGRWLWFHTRISNDSINSCDIYNVCCSYHSDGWILKYKTFSEINLLSIPEYQQCAFQDGSNVLKLCLMWKHFILKGSQNRYLHYSFEMTQSYLKEHNEFILIKIKKEFDANFFQYHQFSNSEEITFIFEEQQKFVNWLLIHTIQSTPLRYALWKYQYSHLPINPNWTNRVVGYVLLFLFPLSNITK